LRLRAIESGTADRAMQIDRTSIVARNPGPVEADLADQTVLLSIESGSYFAVSGPARRIWQLVGEPISVSEVLDTLMDEYDVAPATCEAEVREFLATLVGKGLVRVCPR